MEILIGTAYRISSDTYSIMLEERKEKGEKSKTPGEQCWSSMGWYSDVRQALNALALKHLNKSDAKTIKDLQTTINLFMDDVNHATICLNESNIPVEAPEEFLA